MYNNSIDKKWNGYWQEHKPRFDEKSNKPVFSIDTPPPFVTGELHMGQAFWVCYIDSIARYKRMCGFNVLYPQGWDMQGFPIEMPSRRSTEASLTRAEFYGKCAELAKDEPEEDEGADAYAWRKLRRDARVHDAVEGLQAQGAALAAPDA